MAGQDPAVYTPVIFVKGLDTERRAPAGDEAETPAAINFRCLAGDQAGARLLAGDEA